MASLIKPRLYFLLVLIGLLVSPTAHAVDDIFPAISSSMQISAQNVANQLVPYALRLVGTLFLIQFTIRNWKTALSGQTDVMALLGKMALSFIWIGFLMYLINNNASILNAIFNSFLRLGQIAAGGVNLNPGDIMWNGIALQNNMVVAYNNATGANDGLLNAFKYFFPSMMLSVACLAIMLSFFMIALAVAVATLEFYLILAAAPIAYAMGGLDALKQSSIAPLQTVLSVGYRLIILGVIVGVIKGQLGTWSANFSAVSTSNMTPIWVVVFGCLLGAVAAFSAGKIAGALASGQSNISGNEAMFAGLQMMQTIASTVTAGAAAAQLAAEAGGLAGEAAGGAKQGFAKLADAMGGGTGSISNAGNGAGTATGGGGGDSVEAAQSLLGPLGGSPVASESSNDDGAAGDASDAGIGSSDDRASRDAAGSTESTSGSQASAGHPEMSKALQDLTKTAQGGQQQQSAAAKLGGTVMGHIQGMQHDSGNVGVNVDVHGKD
jgi:P-type conjugative transfer protein TrbL